MSVPADITGKPEAYAFNITNSVYDLINDDDIDRVIDENVDTAIGDDNDRADEGLITEEMQEQHERNQVEIQPGPEAAQ